MSLTFNPALKDQPVYQPGRPIEEVAREIGLPPRDIIKLASNENPLGPSPAALAAMEKVLRQLHLYPDGNAYYLKNKLAAKLGVDASNLILGNGSNEIIEFVGHALMGPGVDVVVSEYCFAVYPMIARLFGANLVTVPAKNFGHDIPAMIRAITPQTRVIFVANPNNPTGTLAPREHVAELINEVPAHALLVMDEAYIEFLGDPIDLLPFVRQGRQNLLLMRTFSKIYGLAGLRLGYGIAAPEIIASLEKIRQPFNSNALAQAAALAALDDEEHIQRTKANEFRKAQWPYLRSAANFVLVKTGDSQRVALELQRHGVITRPMSGYQLPEWLRITIGTPAENERCLKALQTVLAVPTA